jgi:hypothetical protein
MADKPETPQVPVTSEKKKDPKRVEAGKRLAAISRMAKEKKSDSSGTSNTTLAIVGLAIAAVTLVITYRINPNIHRLLYQSQDSLTPPPWTP